MSHPIALWRKTRVSSDAAQHVQLALPVPAEVDGAWCDVDVHKVIHYTALDMVLNLVHQVSGAHVEDLNVGHVSNAQKIGSKKQTSLKYRHNLCDRLFLTTQGMFSTCHFLHQVTHNLSCSIQCASENLPPPCLCRSFHNLGCSVSLPVMNKQK